MTLAAELRRLELQAEEARAASGLYSRSLLAKSSAVSESTLSAWLDGDRTPQDFSNLMKVVSVLADWSGLGQPSRLQWQELWATARKGGGSRQGTTGGKSKRRSQVAAAFLATSVAGAVISGFFTPLGGDLLNLFGPGKASAGSRQAPPEELQASANWCCHFITVNASTGFYWHGSAGALFSALSPASGGAKQADLTPAGLGLLEIPLQTSGTEPILVAPPKVIRVRHQPNLTRGIVAILPRGGQGSGAADEFEADVDAASPVTVPYGRSTGFSNYYYVSSGSPEVLGFFIEDSNCDCTFDIQLSWQVQGHVYSRLLNNGGRHFHIIGSSGLPWYGGDPRFGVKFTRDSGRPFSAYAPGQS